MSALVFAYGSNLCPGQMFERCPSAKFFARAAIQRVTLVFAGSSLRWAGAGVAGLSLARSGKVHGVIYRISNDDLAMLDRYEGHPSVYNRVGCHPTTEAGTRPHVYTYALMRGAATCRAPAPEYLSTVRAGYAAWDLPKDALMRALRRTLEREGLDPMTDRT